MKNLHYFLFCLSFVCLIGCSKDDDDDTITNSITAVIDGTDYDANNITALSDDSLGELLILIAGTETSSGYTIGLNIPITTPVNTPQEIDEFDFGITFTNTAQSAFFTEGTITITSISVDDKTVEGTFSFDATNQANATEVVSITNGAFAVNYL